MWNVAAGCTSELGAFRQMTTPGSVLPVEMGDGLQLGCFYLEFALS